MPHRVTGSLQAPHAHRGAVAGHAEPVRRDVEGDVAVVRLEVRYLEPREQEYGDLWVLRFAADGRVADFEEWASWPGQPWVAPESASPGPSR